VGKFGSASSTLSQIKLAKMAILQKQPDRSFRNEVDFKFRVNRLQMQCCSHPLAAPQTPGKVEAALPK